MNETFWQNVYEKAEYNRIFIQLLREVLPMYEQILTVLK